MKYFLATAMLATSASAGAVNDATLPDNYFMPPDCPLCTVEDHKMLIKYSTIKNCVRERYCVDPSYVHTLDRDNHNYHHTILDTATTCTSDDDCAGGKFCHVGPAPVFGSCQTNHEEFHCTRDSASTCSCSDCGSGNGGKTVDNGKRIHDLSATDDRDSVTKPTTTDGSRQGERWTFVGMGYCADRAKDEIRNFRGTTASKDVCAQLCEDMQTCYGINWHSTGHCEVVVGQGYTAHGDLLAFTEQHDAVAGPINALLPSDDVECWRYTRHTHPKSLWCPEGFDFENDWCNKDGRCDSSSGRITVSWITSTECRNACQAAGDSCAGVVISSDCGLVWAGAENPASGTETSISIFHKERAGFQGEIQYTDTEVPYADATCSVPAEERTIAPTSTPTVSPTNSPTASPTVSPTNSPTASPQPQYSYGTCQPTSIGQDCCPAGYEVITTLEECETAFRSVEPTGYWAGNAPRIQRPYGCFQWQGNMHGHFNPDTPSRLVGDDKVVCKLIV